MISRLVFFGINLTLYIVLIFLQDPEMMELVKPSLDEAFVIQVFRNARSLLCESKVRLI
jgi:hypothetical protein